MSDGTETTGTGSDGRAPQQTEPQTIDDGGLEAPAESQADAAAAELGAGLRFEPERWRVYVNGEAVGRVTEFGPDSWVASCFGILYQCRCHLWTEYRTRAEAAQSLVVTR